MCFWRCLRCTFYSWRRPVAGGLFDEPLRHVVRLTIHSSRCRFAARLNSGVRLTESGADMSEQIFFEHDGVRVSSARFVVKGATYPISAITSVRAVRSKTFPLLAIVLILIG